MSETITEHEAVKEPVVESAAKAVSDEQLIGMLVDRARSEGLQLTKRVLEFSEKWGTKYPAVIKLWSDAWAEMVPFLSLDVEIRKVICSMNAIESVNARIRKAVRARGHFPSEAAALKCVYMALMSLDPTGKGRRRWTMRWKAPLNAFQTAFEGQLPPPQPLTLNNQDQPLIGQTPSPRSSASPEWGGDQWDPSDSQGRRRRRGRGWWPKVGLGEAAEGGGVVAMPHHRPVGSR